MIFYITLLVLIAVKIFLQILKFTPHDFLLGFFYVVAFVGVLGKSKWGPVFVLIVTVANVLVCATMECSLFISFYNIALIILAMLLLIVESRHIYSSKFLVKLNKPL